jgi:hypothetical protein
VIVMPPRNPYLCLTIVLTLGITMLVGLGGIIMLTFADKEPPASLVAVVSGAAGSLSSFLVSVPRGSAGWGDPNTPNRP